MERQRDTIHSSQSRSYRSPIVGDGLRCQTSDFVQINQKISYVLNSCRGWMDVPFITPTAELIPMRLVQS